MHFAEIITKIKQTKVKNIHVCKRATREGAKGAEAPPLSKSKLTIKD